MARFGVKEVADVTFYDLTTGKPVLFLDTLKMSNLTTEAQEAVQTGGKGAPELVSWDFGKTASMEMQDALLNPKAISLKTGNELKEGVVQVHRREFLTTITGTTGSKVTLEQIPVTGTVFVYVSEDGYDHKTEVSDFEIAEKEIEFTSEDVAVGEDVIVYYEYETEATAQTITISSDKFPGYYKVVGDTIVRNEANGQDEGFQIVIPKAKMNSNLTLALDPETPSVFDFNIKILKPADGTDMVKMIKY